MTSSFIMKRAVTAGLVAAVSMGLLAGTAIAGEADVLSDVTKAAQIEGAAPATDTLAVVKQGNQLFTQTDSIKLAVPAGKVTHTPLGSIVDGKGDSQVVFQKVGNGGYRASIYISSPSDSERYKFRVSGASRLEQQPDGSVLALSSFGQAVATIQAPWARDANGQNVPTHYEVDGLELAQVVNHHHATFAYGITADPWLAIGAFAVRMAAREAARRAAQAAIRAALISAEWHMRCTLNPVCNKILREKGGEKAMKWAAENLF